jgi:hypothetical protein
VKNRQFEVLTGIGIDQYLTNVAWSPNEEFLYIAIVNRDQNEMKLNQYDGRSGAFIKTLVTETSEKYVEPEHPITFINNDESKFIWFSNVMDLTSSTCMISEASLSARSPLQSVM